MQPSMLEMKECNKHNSQLLTVSYSNTIIKQTNYNTKINDFYHILKTQNSTA